MNWMSGYIVMAMRFELGPYIGGVVTSAPQK